MISRGRTGDCRARDRELHGERGRARRGREDRGPLLYGLGEHWQLVSILVFEWGEGNREERMPKVMRSSIWIIINRVSIVCCLRPRQVPKAPRDPPQTIDHHHRLQVVVVNC